VKAIERAFREIVESACWKFAIAPDDPDGAIAALVAIQDHEVPAHSRLDLLIVQHATDTTLSVVRALARLFASSQLHRIQPPNEQPPWMEKNNADDEQEQLESARLDLAQRLERTGAGMLFGPGVGPEPGVALEDRRWRARVLPAERLTRYTITSIHIRTLRAQAETMRDESLLRDCNEALRPPSHPLTRALEVREHLAGMYNAFFMDGMQSLGYWTPDALSRVQAAFAYCLAEPRPPRLDDPEDPWADAEPEPARADPLAAAQALLRDLRPEDVHDDGCDDLHRVKTATSCDLATVRAMARLCVDALEWHVRRLRDEMGRSRTDAN
jgi:hypothetical protein